MPRRFRRGLRIRYIVPRYKSPLAEHGALSHLGLERRPLAGARLSIRPFSGGFLVGPLVELDDAGIYVGGEPLEGVFSQHSLLSGLKDRGSLGREKVTADLASLVHAKRLGLAVDSANGAFGLADDGVVALPEGLENGRTDREIPPHPVDLGEGRPGRQRSALRHFKIPAMERLRNEPGTFQQGFHRRSL